MVRVAGPVGYTGDTSAVGVDCADRVDCARCDNEEPGDDVDGAGDVADCTSDSSGAEDKLSSLSRGQDTGVKFIR